MNPPLSGEPTVCPLCRPTTDPRCVASLLACPQVRKLLEKLGSRHAPPDFADKLLFDEIDADGNGKIDRVEWVDFIAKQTKIYGERAMFKLLQTIRKEMDQSWSLPGM